MSPFYIEELLEGADSSKAELIILNLDEGDGIVAIQTGEEVAFGSDGGFTEQTQFDQNALQDFPVKFC
jgi:hypothetical protein